MLIRPKTGLRVQHLAQYMWECNWEHQRGLEVQKRRPLGYHSSDPSLSDQTIRGYIISPSLVLPSHDPTCIALPPRDTDTMPRWHSSLVKQHTNVANANQH